MRKHRQRKNQQTASPNLSPSTSRHIGQQKSIRSFTKYIDTAMETHRTAHIDPKPHQIHRQGHTRINRQLHQAHRQAHRDTSARTNLQTAKPNTSPSTSRHIGHQISIFTFTKHIAKDIETHRQGQIEYSASPNTSPRTMRHCSQFTSIYSFTKYFATDLETHRTTKLNKHLQQIHRHGHRDTSDTSHRPIIATTTRWISTTKSSIVDHFRFCKGCFSFVILFFERAFIPTSSKGILFLDDVSFVKIYLFWFDRIGRTRLLQTIQPTNLTAKINEEIDSFRA